ncbi:DUF2169 family type VI secretion system accessory protein [Roseibium sediminis]|uniref:DUF2169 family type VI secretion system accessory protein n=1 Tax=Roseibium sediminis TaxID=1775174 RepID=UPI00123E289A|nr:DUF2169 domain-containing protein [Roseibium sediminis]
MWEVKNKTPFVAGGAFERDRNGREFWCVAIRARFNVEADGLCRISDDSPWIRLGPEYADEEAQELASDTDIAPFKPSTDILLKGTVQSVKSGIGSQPVRMRVGHLEKRALVLGARILEVNGGKPKLVSQFELAKETPLSWSGAYGGRDFCSDDEAEVCESNPVGTGYCSSPLKALPDGSRVALPLFENPDEPITGESGPVRPTGFGAVQRFWKPRKEHAGTFDETWERSRAPVLPEDFDERFYQTAPMDQIWDGFIRGGETVAFEGFNKEGAYEFRLPQIILEAKTRLGGRAYTTRFNCVSVEFYPDRKDFEMVWNTHVPCNGQDHLISSSLVRVKQMAGVR